MTVTSASACRRALVPNSPPKPEPITTTRCRGAGLVVFTSAITCIVPNIVPLVPVRARWICHTECATPGRAQGRLGQDVPVTHYDLAVIGTGSGNTVVTKKFKDWGPVAIIEENLFGGTRLNVGGIPTKMYVYPADLARNAVSGPALGVDTSYDGARWPDIRARIFGRIDPLAQAGKDYRLRLPNIDVYDEHCTFLDDHTLALHAKDGGSPRRITADRIVIAAGSRVSVADYPGLDEVDFHTS